MRRREQLTYPHVRLNLTRPVDNPVSFMPLVTSVETPLQCTNYVQRTLNFTIPNERERLQRKEGGGEEEEKED